MSNIKLTQYSHGAGCGCKISPKVLTSILHGNIPSIPHPNLLVGNESRDDAAVYDLGNGTAIVSTTDFFMPIVDDPFTFGKIAATNAISDIYAMGGTPLLAIAILGWPISKIEPEVASVVLDGARQTCTEAGIPLAGGHSIDCEEPIFGLAVTGQVEVSKLKRNDTATEGCHLYLTKPLGVGILSTAQKQRKLKAEHEQIAPNTMMQLNSVGKVLGGFPGVTAMTDVTGFGLLGHLAEMCDGSGLSAIIDFSSVPFIPESIEYIAQKCIPGGTYRNWDSYGCQIELTDPTQKMLLCDPQTSGGLLIAVEPNAMREVEDLLRNQGLHYKPIGKLVPKNDWLIRVE